MRAIESLKHTLARKLSANSVALSRAAYNELKQGYDGYRAAYGTMCSKHAAAANSCDRLSKALAGQLRASNCIPLALRSKQLCFLHIGKTAGTSIEHALMELMQGTDIFHASLPQFDEIGDRSLERYGLVLGHFTHRHVVHLSDSRFLFTFLRDPVDRVISNYYFLPNQIPTIDPSSSFAIESARSMDLKSFLECDHPRVRMLTSNVQVKVLSHDYRPDYALKECELFERADQNIKGFDFAGWTTWLRNGANGV